MCGTLDQCALHTAPTKQHGDAAFDAGAEALPALERPALFVRFPFRASLASRLRDAGQRDARGLAGLRVLFVEEATIGTIQRRRASKDGFVAVERRLDMQLVCGVPTEHPILCNQPSPALREEHLMTELHRSEYLTAFDQIRVGFENGIQLFSRGYLLALKDATAGLADDAVAERTVARDLTAERVDGHVRDGIETTNACGSLDDSPGLGEDLFGDPDERAIRAHLPTMSLSRRHALDLLHPAACGPCAVRKRPHSRGEHGGQFANQPRHDPHGIPQQRVVGGMMNIRLDDRGVDPQLRAI